MNIVCIYQPYPGLGDHLQHSTLPKLYHSLGSKVFISNKCVYRNDEIKELVWESNPYVEGFSDIEPNAGMSCPTIQSEAVKIWKPTTVSLTNIELSHGFKRERPRPELHYKPKLISGLSEVTIFDASACTAYSNYKSEKIAEIVAEKFGNDVLYIKSKKIEQKEHEDLSTKRFDLMYVKSIFEYCDVISSCKNFVSLMSGGHSLCQAIRDKNSYCIISDDLFKVHKQRGLFLNEDLVSYIKF